MADGAAPRPDPAAPTHPEEICERCVRPNVVWFAPNEVWNRVMGFQREGILCPVCFIQLAEKRGVKEVWRIEPESLRGSPPAGPAPEPSEEAYYEDPTDSHSREHPADWKANRGALKGYRIAGEPVTDAVGAEFGKLIAERDRLAFPAEIPDAVNDVWTEAIARYVAAEFPDNSEPTYTTEQFVADLWDGVRASRESPPPQGDMRGEVTNDEFLEGLVQGASGPDPRSAKCDACEREDRNPGWIIPSEIHTCSLPGLRGSEPPASEPPNWLDQIYCIKAVLRCAKVDQLTKGGIIGGGQCHCPNCELWRLALGASQPPADTPGAPFFRDYFAERPDSQ